MTTIWSVMMRDHKYSGQTEKMLGEAKDAAQAASKALTAVKKNPAYKRPYVESVELVGSLEF